MLLFPNAKINIGLNILHKREDGFHELETLFYPLQLADMLEFVPADKFYLRNTGIAVDAAWEDNLVYKAYQLLKNNFDLPPLETQLHKIIPFGAGLGGGSADASLMLVGLNKHFNLGLNDKQLINYASILGSDCAFFILNKPCLATGRGEILQPVDFSLKGWHLLLVKPDIHVSTKAAYAGVTPSTPDHSLQEAIKLPVEAWEGKIVNDFEKSVFPQFPGIAKVKEQLYNKGAVYAAMSGSGSSVFALFREKPEWTANEFGEKAFIWYEEIKE